MGLVTCLKIKSTHLPEGLPKNPPHTCRSVCPEGPTHLQVGHHVGLLAPSPPSAAPPPPLIHTHLQVGLANRPAAKGLDVHVQWGALLNEHSLIRRLGWGRLHLQADIECRERRGDKGAAVKRASKCASRQAAVECMSRRCRHTVPAVPGHPYPGSLPLTPCVLTTPHHPSPLTPPPAP